MFQKLVFGTAVTVYGAVRTGFIGRHEVELKDISAGACMCQIKTYDICHRTFLADSIEYYDRIVCGENKGDPNVNTVWNILPIDVIHKDIEGKIVYQSKGYDLKTPLIYNWKAVADKIGF